MVDAAGAGELAAGVDRTMGSAGSPLLLSATVLLSLTLPLLLLCCEASLPSLLSSPFCSWDFGVRQEGSSQTTPVKLFNWNDFRSHLRQGLPERSRARKPALIAPWFAFGPSLWVVIGATGPGVGLRPWSIVPSSLKALLASALYDVVEIWCTTT